MTGCCPECGGSGISGDIETNGRCWDCYGTGHNHHGLTEEEYRRVIQAQRDLGRAQVGIMLDKMCEHFGMDPIEVWRKPRLLREYERIDLTSFRVRYMIGMPILNDARMATLQP